MNTMAFFKTEISDSMPVFIFNRLVDLIFLFAIYALISTIIFFIKAIRNKNDELVKKIVVDALASTAVCIILLHFAQMLARVIYFQVTGENLHLVITSGFSISALGDVGNHLEAFGFDMGLFAIFSFINKLRYR